MAASTSGALKAQIESLGLSIRAYRDRAPEGTKLPYVSIDEAVAVVPDKLEDGQATTGKETVTIHVFMSWKDPSTGAVLESYSLPGAIIRGLQGVGLQAGPTRSYAVIVQREGPRIVEEETNIVHVPISAVVWRTL